MVVKCAYSQHAVCKEVVGYEIHIDKMNFIKRKIVGAVMGIRENSYKLSEETIGEFARTLVEI